MVRASQSWHAQQTMVGALKTLSAATGVLVWQLALATNTSQVLG